MKYCRSCGKEVAENTLMCVACGSAPMSGNKYCFNCKVETATEAIMCIKCGVSLKGVGTGKDWLTTLLICLFFGYVGGHRFYTKHTGIGVVQLLTFGACGFWVLIDLVQIISGTFKDADGNLLVKK